MTTPLKKVPIHLQSASNRLLIKNGILVSDKDVLTSDIYIEDDKIKQIGKHLLIPGGTRVIDASGKFVIPGGIDSNVHFQTPAHGTRTIDDFYNGTRAALKDGTTMIIDTVIPEKGEHLLDALSKWKSWANDKVCCDYAFKIKLTSESGVKDVIEEGINTFVLSMKELSDGEILDRLEYLPRYGVLPYIECYSKEIIELKERKTLEKGITGPEGLIVSHSEMAEEEAVFRALTLAIQNESPLYISNIMSRSALDLLRRKKSLYSVFAETSVCALASDSSAYLHPLWSKAAAFVTQPPLPSPGTDRHLLEALSEGTLDVLASNHATFTSQQKAIFGKLDFRKIPPGVNGCESRMSILWEKGVHTGHLTPSQFVAVTSTNPAKIFNIYPKKGCLAVGSDADVVIWNPNLIRNISSENDLLKSDINIFEGLQIHGGAEYVILGGRLMVDESHLRSMQGIGNFIPLPPFSPTVFQNKRNGKDYTPVFRSEKDMMLPPLNDGDIPGPPEPPPSNVATPAPSQQESNFDLKSHPNIPDKHLGKTDPNCRNAKVRIQEPPGGKSSGSFW